MKMKNARTAAAGLRRSLQLAALPMLLAACAPQDSGRTSDSGPFSYRDYDQDGVTAAADCDDGDPRAALPATWYADADEDGYGDPQATTTACQRPEGHVANAEDCDDDDDQILPGAVETCDGIDNDCDGQTDEYDDRREPTGHLDLDGDGRGTLLYPTYDCVLPDGYVTSGDDCDDADAQTHPGAPERCDGVDNDCDGLADEQPDGDLDGYLASACGGDDCDDEDAEVNPGAEEVCDDGVDNDCDGSSGRCGISGQRLLSSADAILHGESSSDYSGSSVAGVGDVDMDGFDDLLIGAHGNDLGGDGAGLAYLVRGPLTGGNSLYSVGIRLLGENDELAGYSVAAAGDSNGNNYADLLVGAPNNDETGIDAGMAYLVQGPLTADLELTQADARLLGEASRDAAGNCVSSAGDVNADGFEDILVGAYCEDSGAFEAGAVYLLLGPLRGDISLDQADAKLIGESDSDQAGVSVAAAGDTNGDGFGDILAGAKKEDAGGSSAGAAYLVLGPVTGELDLESADAKLRGENGRDSAGIVAGAGDLDGDGYHDMLVGAYMQDESASNAGAVYVVHGPLEKSSSLRWANAKLLGSQSNGHAGFAVAGPGDVDGDGEGDVLVGAYSVDLSGSNAGVAILARGPFRGTLSLNNAQATLCGEGSSDYAGYAVAGAGDVNADGWPDLLVGAYGNDSAASSAGASYLLLGGGM